MQKNKIMKRTCFFIVLYVLFASSCVVREKKLIVCVGDSITEGDGLENRVEEAYPAVLADVLEKDYDVVNFGQSGATLLKNGDYPYWEKIAYKNSLAVRPDIIVILLGANDSKPQNIPSHPGEFIVDLRVFVDNYKQLESKPQVFLCTPMPSFDNSYNISDSVLLTDVVPAVRQVAQEFDCKIIDLHSAFWGKKELTPDGVHPNKAGAVELARYISKHIQE